MRNLGRWLTAQFKTLDLLPEYFQSAKQEWWRILWGESLVAIAFVLWVLLAPMPIWAIICFLLAAFAMASYYIWRADHIRLIPTIRLRFEYREPFVQMTPATSPGRDIVLARYWRVFPDCSTRIENCTGYLLGVFKEVNGHWEPTAFDEAVPLIWANRNYAGPLTIEPNIGPYLDVFYTDSVNKEIIPCTGIKMHRASLVFKERATFRLDIQITNSAPISLKVRMDDRPSYWDRPLVDLLPYEKSNSN